MAVIYFDNFRGFENTFLPLRNVNFFVGENSTGKTSVLKLIKMMSDERFWISMDLVNDEAELGRFSEIISSGSKRKKHFTIATLADRDPETSIMAYKFKFESQDDTPYASEIQILDQNLHLIINRSNEDIRYKYQQIENSKNKDPYGYFQNWVINGNLQNEKWIEIDKGDRLISLPIYYLIHTVIMKQIMKDNQDKNLIRLSSFLHQRNFLSNVLWLAPIRSHPKRTYDGVHMKFHPDGTHAPYTLKKLLSKTNLAKKVKVLEILKKFGADSGLFEDIDVHHYGGDSTPFELRVCVDGVYRPITNVGYGVSQILPIIIDGIASEEGSWCAIQQPEIHLHPRGQAAFGDFLLQAALVEHKNFIIETHSDYTIDRYRFKLSKYKKDHSVQINSQVVFFNRKEHKNTLTCLKIADDGTYPIEQPEEFRAFFIKEQLDQLTML